MGREQQKKKNRSSLQKVKPKLRGRTKAGKKKVNFLGNDLIERNWDRKLTLSQNYNRLGLSSRLNAASGGTESKERDVANSALSIPSGKPEKELVPQETRVERDPETGHILRIVRPESWDDLGNEDKVAPNPLNDPLNNLSDEAEEMTIRTQDRGIVGELEAQVAEEAKRLAKTKRPRQQSQRESEWVQSLVMKHGNNVTAMVRDQKLNPMQQSEGDIRRRLKTWQASRQSGDTV